MKDKLIFTSLKGKDGIFFSFKCKEKTDYIEVENMRLKIFDIQSLSKFNNSSNLKYDFCIIDANDFVMCNVSELENVLVSIIKLHGFIIIRNQSEDGFNDFLGYFHKLLNNSQIEFINFSGDNIFLANYYFFRLIHDKNVKSGNNKVNAVQKRFRYKVADFIFDPLVRVITLMRSFLRLILFSK